MRLIDADALIKALVRKEPFSDCARVVIAECMEEVRHAPTIEPERKKGEWVDGRCSICGCDAPAYIIDWKWQKDMGANFCPNCGADMWKEGEHE